MDGTPGEGRLLTALIGPPRCPVCGSTDLRMAPEVAHMNTLRYCAACDISVAVPDDTWQVEPLENDPKWRREPDPETDST